MTPEFPGKILAEQAAELKLLRECVERIEALLKVALDRSEQMGEDFRAFGSPPR
jgi:hypothetical protein